MPVERILSRKKPENGTPFLSRCGFRREQQKSVMLYLFGLQHQEPEEGTHTQDTEKRKRGKT